MLHDPTLMAALEQSLELAALTMLIATPLGTALALGLQRWRGPARDERQHGAAAAAGDAGARVRGRHVPAVHDVVRVHRARHDRAGDRPRHVLDVVGGGDRARAAGHARHRHRGGRGRPRRAAARGRPADPAAAADAGDRGEPARRLRAVDRRLRRGAVPVLGRRHDDGADAHLLAGAQRADPGAQRAGHDHARGHAAGARAGVPGVPRS